MANLYSILDSLEKESRGERTDAEDFNDELNNVRDSVPEYNLSTGERTPNTDIQKAINEFLRDEVRTITSPRDMGVIDNAIREFNLQALAKGLNYKGLDINRREVNTMKDILTDQNMIDIGKLSGVSQVGNLQEYYDREGKLPSFLSLARNQFTPSGLESLLDRELDAIDNPDLSTGTRISTYDPITPENQDKTFSNREITALGEMLAARDKDKDNKMAVGEIDTAIYSKNANKADELNIELDNIDNPNIGNIDYLRGKTIGSAVTDSIGKGKYGHYDPMSGEWYAGIPDEEGNYTLKDDYNWNKSRQSGIRSMIDLALAPSKRSDQQKVEGIFQTLGSDSRKNEGQKIEINVPTYNNDLMGLMNVLSSRLGSGKYNFIADDSSYEFEPGKETPLGQGDLPGMYWQPEAFTSSEDSGDDYSDQGYSDSPDDSVFGMKGGGHIFREVNKLKMNNRNAKNNLYEMIGIKPVVAKQYGGGLSDAYSTLADRRQNMYGMGQTPSQMSSVFQDPMEASAFSPVNMEQGGDIVVPKERMINDQPHELSYINPQEAGLLKALGGSGRRVDGIPAYYDTDDEGFYGDDSTDATTDSGDMGDGNFATDPGLAQGITGVAPSTPSEEDDYSTYATYGTLGDTRDQDKAPGEGDPGSFQQYGLTASQIMDNYNKQGGFSRDIGPLLSLYTPEQLSRAFAVPGAVANIRDAFMNNNFVGGGLPSTLEDAINKGQNIQYGPAFLAAQNRARAEEELDMITEDEFGEKKGSIGSTISSVIDTVKDFIMGGKDLSPENQAKLNADLSKFGATFTPPNAFTQTLTSLAIPMAATLGAKALGTPQTLGFITNRDGLTFEVTKDSKGNIGTEVTSGPGSSGGLDQIDRNDSGNDQVKRKRIVKPDTPKQVTEVIEEKEKVTTEGKLSNRAKASAESIKSLIKLRNASSDAQIDAIISDLGIDKAGLTVPEFLKELGIER